MHPIVVRSKRRYAQPIPEGYTAVPIDRSHPILGNPFVLKNANDAKEREQVIAQYENWLTARLNEPAIEQALSQLAERVASGEKLALMCWCDPKPCHGHFLQRLIQERAAELHYHNDGMQP